MDATEPPPPSHASKLLNFLKCDYGKAPLTCLSEIQCKNIGFGFTAFMDFFPSDVELSISSSQFFHDQENFQVVSNLENGEKLKMDFRYANFGKMNFEIQKSEEAHYSIEITFSSTPLFFKGTKDKNQQIQFKRFDPRTLEPSNNWDSFIKATAFQMEFTSTEAELYSLLNQLDSCLPCALTFHPLGLKTFFDSRICFLNTKEWPWETRYRFEAIKLYRSGIYFLDYILFYKNEIDNIDQENGFDHEYANKLFNAMHRYLQDDISLSSLDGFNMENFSTTKNLGSDYVLIKTVYVTPTRMILALDEATMNNRGFRKIGIENLIQIKYRDDDNLSLFPRDDDHLKNVVLAACRDGIQIAGKQFYDIFGSSSLFRDQGGYFVATDRKDEVLEYWRGLGNFQAQPTAKFGARIGQHFTSARELPFKFKLSEVLLIDDYMSEAKDSSGKNYCFSDGVGIIDEAFAKRIARHLGISYIPSAFQIRFAGFKGMVSVDKANPNLRSNGGNYCVCLRKSQKKFDTNDDGEPLDFDIVQWSAPAPANLHRSFIVMLDAHARREGKQEDFHNRMYQLLNDCSMNVLKPLIDNNAFINSFKKLPKYFPIEKMARKDLIDEQFLRSMVEVDTVLKAKALSKKIPIPIDFGRQAFGIVDTTGTLKHGEVFFQYSDTLKSKTVSSEIILRLGRVGITKSPIYHAGDIRYLTAVDVPELYHLRDVLVFPSQGSRLHPDEMGGGDLDGDMYTIFWDPAFLFDDNVPAADYTAPKIDLETNPNVSIEELQNAHPHFRAKYMLDNNLQSLSNCYLAHIILHDPNQAECEKVAEKCDIAVNYSKSGLKAKTLKLHEKHIFWPKFMGKRHEPAFTTSHILCQLYDRATSLYQLIEIAQREAQQQRTKIQPSTLSVPIKENDQKLFQNYKAEMLVLMNKHQISSEGELFGNAFLDDHGTTKTYKSPLANKSSQTSITQREVFNLFEKYRTMILDRFGNIDWKADMEARYENIFSYKIKNVPAEMIELAKSFYALADGECYSFPWIAWEGLDAWWSNEKNASYKSGSLLPSIEYAKTLYRFPESETWLLILTSEIEFWENHNSLNSELVSYVFKWFLNSLEKFDVDRSVTTTFENGGRTFSNFLIYIISTQFSDIFDALEKQKLLKVAYCTFVTLAFMPPKIESNFFNGETLYNKVITFPSFVISIPNYWCNNFKRDYTLLKQYSGCQEIAIGLRRSFKFYSHFTIMAKGTLESCKNLETMLTPVIEADYSASMKEVKEAKILAMNKLIQNIFNFPTPKYSAENPRVRPSQAFRKKQNSKNFKRPWTQNNGDDDDEPSPKRQQP